MLPGGAEHCQSSEGNLHFAGEAGQHAGLAGAISIVKYSVVKTQNLRVVKSAKRCGHRITGRQINIRDGRLTLLGNLADKSELKHLS